MLCGIQKDMTGGIDPSILTDMLNVSKGVALERFRILDEFLNSEEKRRLMDVDNVGFHAYR
jgi:hypothetical protein